MEGGSGEVVAVLVSCDDSPHGLERKGAAVGPLEQASEGEESEGGLEGLHRAEVVVELFGVSADASRVVAP